MICHLAGRGGMKYLFDHLFNRKKRGGKGNNEVY